MKKSGWVDARVFDKSVQREDRVGISPLKLPFLCPCLPRLLSRLGGFFDKVLTRGRSDSLFSPLPRDAEADRLASIFCRRFEKHFKEKNRRSAG